MYWSVGRKSDAGWRSRARGCAAIVPAACARDVDTLVGSRSQSPRTSPRRPHAAEQVGGRAHGYQEEIQDTMPVAVIFPPGARGYATFALTSIRGLAPPPVAFTRLAALTFLSKSGVM